MQFEASVRVQVPCVSGRGFVHEGLPRLRADPVLRRFPAFPSRTELTTAKRRFAKENFVYDPGEDVYIAMRVGPHVHV
jgi:hypothetical protein